MDEEDGRLGPQVHQLGRCDVLPDASTKFCAIHPISRHRVRVPQVSIPTRVPNDRPSPLGWLRPGSNLSTSKDLNQNEEKNENLPGK